MSRKEVFTTIYKSRLWGHEDPSGPGSIDEHVAPLWRELPILFEDYQIKSIVDLGCGSFNWISNALTPDIAYLGCDIVDGLIQENQVSYASSTVKFKVLDATIDEIPKADLITCRSALFHLNNQEILETLENIKRSGARWLLTTSFTYRSFEVNSDIETGGFRRINLELDPFNLPSPVRTIFDLDGDSNNFSTALCLWDLDSMKK
jgi:2-polyprenyl-3-methyl-5-hydroxy-6-metoxy-1,4-benzoquinol methylase